jgi:hypothetical protein
MNNRNSIVHFRVAAACIALSATLFAPNSVSAKTTKVTAAEINRYWRSALLGKVKGQAAYNGLVAAKLIPKTRTPPVTVTDDPPSGPGVLPPGPGDGGEFDPNNPEPVPDNQKPDAAHLKITVKSYIDTINPPLGAGVGVFPLLRRNAAQAFATATDISFSENPLTDAMIKDYRLFTQTEAIVVCMPNGNLTKWQFSKLISDTGTEPPKGAFVFQAPNGFIRGAKFGRVNPSTIAFEWTFYGRPHPVPAVALQLVMKRTSVYIWHHIAGTIACAVGKPPVVKANIVGGFNGSAFPSHRWWVNNVVQGTINQGPMLGLWKPIAPGSNVVK